MKDLNDIEITRVKGVEVSLLRTLSIDTFSETFASSNTEYDMELYIGTNLSEEQLLSEITDNSSQFYVAWIKNKPAGYLKINFPKNTTLPNYKEMLEIERIYILKDYQGMRVGETLLTYSKQIAQTNGLKGIWLGVWEHNLKAIQFYKKHLFTKTGSHVFKLGNDEQTDDIMELNL